MRGDVSLYSCQYEGALLSHAQLGWCSYHGQKCDQRVDRGARAQPGQAWLGGGVGRQQVQGQDKHKRLVWKDGLENFIIALPMVGRSATHRTAKGRGVVLIVGACAAVIGASIHCVPAQKKRSSRAGEPRRCSVAEELRAFRVLAVGRGLVETRANPDHEGPTVQAEV